MTATVPMASTTPASTKTLTPTNPFHVFPPAALAQTLTARFEQQAAQYPERCAVQSRHDTLTYEMLNHQANALALALLESTGWHTEAVALLLDQGAPVTVGLLGAVKAGKPFVVLDPTLPPARLAYILQDAQAASLVTSTTHAALARTLADDERPTLLLEAAVRQRQAGNPGLTVSPDALACLLYTSGSTGQPKGVMHTHRTLLHGVMRRTNSFHISPDDHLTLFSSGTTQALMNILSSIMNGATLHPLPIKQEGVSTLASWLRQQQITIYHSAAPLFQHFIQTLSGHETFPDLRLIRLASDTVYRRDVEMYQAHFAPACLFANGLSSTETGNHCLYFLDKTTPLTSRIVPVGYALEGMELVILNEEGVEMGTNSVGEIGVRSRYLSPGYWRQPALTREIFLPDPTDSTVRVYRTRDIGRLHADGCLEYLGRQGARVQIRGYRIEVAEVEAAVRALETVREAVVLPHDPPQGPTQLLAYVVPSTTPSPSQDMWRRAVAQTLPDYMIPTAFITLDALPMTPNGKIDRRALPAPEPQRLALGAPYMAPRTDVEVTLVRLWGTLLGVGQVGVHDDFFALGGHSLLAMQLLTRLRTTFHMDIPLATFITAPTVAALARAIREPGGQQLSRWLLPYKPYGSRPPFFCVHGVELLARHMDVEQPFYAFHPHGLDGRRAPDTVEAMAAEYVEAMRTCQAQGPYYLGGYSFGGVIALEMAQQLRQAGQEVALLVLLDSGGPNAGREAQQTLLSHGADYGRLLLAWSCNFYLRPGRYLPLRWHLSYFLGMSRRASQRYIPRRYAGPLHLLHARENPRDPRQRWGELSPAGLTVYDVPGNHTTMLLEPQVQQVAMQLTQVLQAAYQARPPEHA